MQEKKLYIIAMIGSLKKNMRGIYYSTYLLS